MLRKKRSTQFSPAAEVGCSGCGSVDAGPTRLWHSGGLGVASLSQMQVQRRVFRCASVDQAQEVPPIHCDGAVACTVRSPFPPRCRAPQTRGWSHDACSRESWPRYGLASPVIRVGCDPGPGSDSSRRSTNACSGGAQPCRNNPLRIVFGCRQHPQRVFSPPHTDRA